MVRSTVAVRAEPTHAKPCPRLPTRARPTRTAPHHTLDAGGTGHVNVSAGGRRGPQGRPDQTQEQVPAAQPGMDAHADERGVERRDAPQGAEPAAHEALEARRGGGPGAVRP